MKFSNLHIAIRYSIVGKTVERLSRPKGRIERARERVRVRAKSGKVVALQVTLIKFETLSRGAGVSERCVDVDEGGVESSRCSRCSLAVPLATRRHSIPETINYVIAAESEYTCLGDLGAKRSLDYTAGGCRGFAVG